MQKGAPPATTVHTPLDIDYELARYRGSLPAFCLLVGEATPGTLGNASSARLRSPEGVAHACVAVVENSCCLYRVRSLAFWSAPVGETAASLRLSHDRWPC